MNFFKSILSDEPDPQKDVVNSDPDPNYDKPDSRSDSTSPAAADADGDAAGGLWTFGGLFKTISTRSESVLETYRRDLQEFGSGLKKETELFREVATRAVKDLPNSIDTLLTSAETESETPDANRRSLNSGRYSRFESQLMNIQSDPNTFCADPEDMEEFKKWKLGFDLKEKGKEIENLIGQNESLEGMYRRVVPNEVENETFWCRYFYKVYRLKQQESVRAKLVNRAMSIDDDEELSWDVDDDDDNNNEQEGDTKLKVDEHVQEKEGSVVERSVNDVKKLDSGVKESVRQDSTNVSKEIPKQDSTSVAKELPINKSAQSKEDSTNVVKQATHSDESKSLSSAAIDKKEENPSNVDGGDKSQVVESSGSSKDSKKGDTEATSTSQGKKEEGVMKGSEGEGDKDESGKVPIGSSQKTGADEDDLDWAEIEDIEGNDDKRATSHVSSSNRADLRKRLSVEEDDEDLSWDIEDDDEPAKA
ncbi:hypothetical protein CQW23_22138 [Capsicum baccatum]|uniref:BSD domain-containing protein n=1 Tax=Capsicum baccatum TaxID=33114 RepID=A0A2G2W014_CAPBA|nr:hypothetical protein CQW23_22138 [Capsicum baccatum]